MLRYLCFFLLLSLNVFSLNAQSRNAIQLVIDFKFESFMVEQLPNAPIPNTGMATLQKCEVVNEDFKFEQKQSYWLHGSFNRTHQKKFTIPTPGTYIIKYQSIYGPQSDTLDILRNTSHTIYLNKQEANLKANDKTLIDQLAVGDTLHIDYTGTSLSVKSSIQIIRQKATYTAYLTETSQATKKTFHRFQLTPNDLKLIRLFENDSKRSFPDGCNDMQFAYTIRLKNESSTVIDNCGYWGGYHLLKWGLFLD